MSKHLHYDSYILSVRGAGPLQSWLRLSAMSVVGIEASAGFREADCFRKHNFRQLCTGEHSVLSCAKCMLLAVSLFFDASERLK